MKSKAIKKQGHRKDGYPAFGHKKIVKKEVS